jgi:large subunit ribosomal protein L27e
MAKFYKPGRLVVVTNGRYAGKKGIIVRSNFEGTKAKKFPHCLVLGLAKPPRRVTKRSLKKLEEKTKALTDKINSSGANAEALNKLKRLGVFLKTYNMGHILATRYKASDNFGIESHITKIENIETELKETTAKLNKKEAEDSKDAAGIEDLKKKIGELKEKTKKSFGDFKLNTGVELFNRFSKGFVRDKNTSAEDNERIASSEFLFNKLKF